MRAARQLVGALEHKRLAVRLGVLEVLEDITGDDFDYDPWKRRGEQKQALGKWSAWAAKAEKAIRGRFLSSTKR